MWRLLLLIAIWDSPWMTERPLRTELMVNAVEVPEIRTVNNPVAPDPTIKDEADEPFQDPCVGYQWMAKTSNDVDLERALDKIIQISCDGEVQKEQYRTLDVCLNEDQTSDVKVCEAEADTTDCKLLRSRFACVVWTANDRCNASEVQYLASKLQIKLLASRLPPAINACVQAIYSHLAELKLTTTPAPSTTPVSATATATKTG
ncbi:unnamed protein product, partial [Mesorhabditis spiculigera]